MAHVRRHPKSGRWQVRYRDPSGRERSRNFERRVDADRFAATVVADVVRGDYLDPTLAKSTVGEFAERWQATRGHLAQATRDQDRHISRLAGFGYVRVASGRVGEAVGGRGVALAARRGASDEGEGAPEARGGPGDGGR